MRGKNSLILGLFLLAILVNINSIQALTYDCEFRQATACQPADDPWDNVVFKASALTNAHGAIYTEVNPEYDYVLCCNFFVNRPASCTTDSPDTYSYIDNRTIKLSSTTNAHGESPQYFAAQYTNDVCYGNLECVQVLGNCPVNDYPIDAFSLSNYTNGHIAAFNIYPSYNYCCRNPAEPVPANCGNGIIEAPLEQCDNSTNNANTCTASYGNSCAYCTIGTCLVGIVQGGYCGDQIINGPEECDLGSSNGVAGSGCSSTCTSVCVPKTLEEACTLAYGAGYECGNANNGCGTDYICDTCPPPGRLNDDQCNLTTGRCYEPPPAPCSFISARWDRLTAVSGDTVQLIVQGSNCNGLSVSFEIWEDDLIGDDSLVSLGGTNPTSGIMSGGVLMKAWNAQYFGDPDADTTEDEYYFKATIAGIGTEESGLGGGIRILKVSAPVIPPVDQCTGILTCADYNATTCEADACNKSCSSGVACGGSCPGPNWNDNVRCVWNATASTCGVAFNPVNCPVTQCGNEIQEVGESCDGNNFVKPDGSRNYTCQDFGFSGGSLTCSSCEISTSSCLGYHCDINGSVEFRNESCDLGPPLNLTRFNNNTGAIIGTWLCIDFDQFMGGSLSCDDTCNFDTANCTFSAGGNGGVVLGNCTYNTGNVISCDNPLSNGLYEASWTGDWGWGSNNYTSNESCQAQHGVGKCVYDEGGYHYYPLGTTDWANCEDGGQNTIECPAQIRLPFFGNIQFIITLLVIALIYGMLRLDKRKK